MVHTCLTWQVSVEDPVEHMDSKMHLKKLTLYQKRRPLTVKPAKGSKRVKKERPEGEVVRRSERLLATKLRELIADSQRGHNQGQQLTRKGRRRKGSSKQ